MTYRAAIFDIDGVVVDSPHEQAWRESLRELMETDWRSIRDRTTWMPDGFSPEVYQQQVSGKPRLAGARAALDHFGVPDAVARATEYAAHKQAMVERLIEAGGFTAYPDALRFVVVAKGAGLLLAAASSSKNAAAMLGRIRLDTHGAPAGGLPLLDLFDVDVSGRDFAHGKPHPEMFLTAAAELGVVPAEAVVFEDAIAGVEAAKGGGMAAVGIARADDAALLVDAGADLVVASFDDIDHRALLDGRLVTR